MADRLSRDWLRGFLSLDARSGGGSSVAMRDIVRQEDTVLRALALLDQQPGVALADEVGMGKTYEALGVVAARLHERSDARVVILTPGPDLNTKWVKEIRSFGDRARPMYRSHIETEDARNLAGLVQGLKKAQVVVAPVNVFAGSRSGFDQAFLLSAWADERGLAGNQIAAILRRYRGGDLSRVDPTAEAFLGEFEHTETKAALRAALKQHQNTPRSLDEIWKQGGYDTFGDRRLVDAALSDLRFQVLNQLVPEIDLLVVDEAHKLKNADSVRATGVRTVFRGKFDKALFLTATPFQLSVDELRHVFDLFSLARNAPSDLSEKASGLLEDVREYASCYTEFERVWSQVDAPSSAAFAAWFARDPELSEDIADPSIRVVGARARKLLELKRSRIEPGFRAWMIRSLREDKREYRNPVRSRLHAEGGSGVPFLLYERFIAELFRTNARTHKAAVQINMVSSYGAAREGALLSDEVKASMPASAETYRKLLQGVVGDLRDDGGGHPKVAHVVEQSLAAARQGEKTLIFCARIQTLHELKREIERRWDVEMLEAWRRSYPDAQEDDIFDTTEDESKKRGLHSKLQTRFQRGQDALYLALRERYVPTLLKASEFALENAEPIANLANALLAKQRLPSGHAVRTDWSVLKRCVEQAATLALRDANRLGDAEADDVARLLDPQFIALGFDLEADDVESASVGDQVPQWSIAVEDVRIIVSGTHLWSFLQSPLYAVPPALRVRTVERLAGYLVSKHVPFLADLLAYASSKGMDVQNIESRVFLPLVDSFWTSPLGRPWCDRLRKFLDYAVQLDEARRQDVLDDLATPKAFVRHTVDGASRERLREAFNTPLYPMILVANEVMQEGLDLHHHCRRIVHHDLAWNPAQLEQRVGRIDRLGSLVQRMRAKAPDTKLEISMPLIRNTIDERLERTVRMRERWLEFLLGAPPKIEEYGLADEQMLPLPEGFSRALAVDLGPTGERAGESER